MLGATVIAFVVDVVIVAVVDGDDDVNDVDEVVKVTYSITAIDVYVGYKVGLENEKKKINVTR